MKTMKLSAQARVDFGKKFSKKLRKEEKTPAIIYGGEKNIHLAVETKLLKNLVYTPDVYKLEIDVDGTQYTAILKDIQFHPVTDEILHVDFQELAGKPVVLSVPVKLSGSSKGVLQGGKLRKNVRRLNVRALGENLPDAIHLDITEIKIGQSIRVSDVPAEKFDILNAANAVIVAVKTARGVAADEEEGEEEAAAEA